MAMLIPPEPAGSRGRGPPVAGCPSRPAGRERTAARWTLDRTPDRQPTSTYIWRAACRHVDWQFCDPDEPTSRGLPMIGMVESETEREGKTRRERH